VATASGSPGTKSTTSTASIVGAAAGLSVLVAILGLSALFYVRKRRTHKKPSSAYNLHNVDLAAAEITPFSSSPYDPQEAYRRPQYTPAGTPQGSPRQQYSLPSTPYMDEPNTGRLSQFSRSNSGYPMSDATTSTSTAFAYGTLAGAYPGSGVVTSPSLYSTVDSYRDAQANYPVDAAVLAGREAGPSVVGMPAGAPANVPPQPRKVDLPVPVTRGSVYQHADIDDDVEEIELPPAYKHRADGHQ